MKKNKMLRYFSNYVLLMIAGAALVIGGFLLWYYSWEYWRFGTPLMAVGAVLLIVFFAMRIDDSTYSDYIKTKMLKMPENPESKPDYVFEGYLFEDNHYAKVDKSGKVRSETAVHTHIYLDKTLKVIIGTVNAETDSEKFEEYDFSSVSVNLETVDISVKGTTKKLAVMQLFSEDKKCAFPVNHNDIEVDQLCEKLTAKYK